MTVDRLKKWPADLAAWLLVGWIGWLALLAPFLIFSLLVLMLSCWEPRIRLTGMVLELSGLLTVALGLRETRKLFGRQGLFTGIWSYLTTVPLPWGTGDKQVILASAAISLGGATLAGHATVLPGPNTPVEERLSRLENEVARLSGEAFQIRQSIDEAGRKHRQVIDEEATRREAGDAETRKQLEEAEAGGLHLEVAGVCWIALGILLATASNEIASMPFFSACLK